MRHLMFASTALAAALALAGCPQDGAERTVPEGDAAAATGAATPDDATPAMQEPSGMPTDPATSPADATAKRAPGQEGVPVAAWRAFGNEPFWSVRVEGETLVFSTPENQAGTVLQGRRVPSLVGVVMLGQEAGREFNLSISPGECSDGMSDNRYDHTATWIYGGTTYHGCAEAAKAK